MYEESAYVADGSWGLAVLRVGESAVVPPQIVTQPQSRSNVVDTTASFSVTATGTSPLSYQWRKGYVPLLDSGRITGATSNTLWISNAQADDAGDYTVVVTNIAGSVTSAVAILAIYHTADYRAPFWQVDGTEVNRVLSYWRAGAYHCDAAGADGFAPGAGATNGPRHGADYRAPYWIIDGTEVNRVLSYWRAGGYHRDTTGVDGYAPGAP